MATLNPLVTDTGSPPIPAAYRWLEAYDGTKGPAILLSQASPTDPPHPELLARLSAAAAEPASARYGDIRGDAKLREAFAAETTRIYGGAIGPENIAITAGCNLAFVVCMMALARAGDVVLLAGPWYFNHKMTLDMLGIEAREIPCLPETGFVPDTRHAEWLIDRRVRAIVLVSPNNPTGAIYPPSTIAAFHELCRLYGLTLVLDETYRDFLPRSHGRPHALAETGWPDGLVQLYSFSKAYHVPGYRLGAITATPAMQREIAKLLDCLQICPARVAQGPLAWAVGALGAWRDANRDRIVGLGAAFAAAMARLKGWHIRSIGSYFAYVEHPYRGVEGEIVAERLAREQGVLVLPGSWFGPGQGDYVRIAFANLSNDEIGSTIARIAALTPPPPADARVTPIGTAKRRLAKGRSKARASERLGKR